MCHMSHVTYIYIYFFLLSGGSSWWRVCYQWGYPVLFLGDTSLLLWSNSVVASCRNLLHQAAILHCATKQRRNAQIKTEVLLFPSTYLSPKMLLPLSCPQALVAQRMQAHHVSPSQDYSFNFLRSRWHPLAPRSRGRIFPVTT